MSSNPEQPDRNCAEQARPVEQETTPPKPGDQTLLLLEAKLTAAEAALSEAQEGKDTAYSERDRLVCALSKCFPSHMERHPESDTTWDDDWRWIVFIDFPTGQGSWHIHDSELSWFDHLTRREGNTWDGHSTTEKYARVARMEIIHQLPNYQRQLSEAQQEAESQQAQRTMIEAELQRQLSEARQEWDKLLGALQSSNASAKRRGEQVTQQAATIRQYKKTMDDMQPRTFPFNCEMCGKVIDSPDDYEWHGIGDCAPICGACDGNGYGDKFTQQAVTISNVTEFLDAIVTAFKEPDGGPYFKLRAFAEKHGIYVDDLGRDRVMLRIAQAALASIPKEPA